MRDLTARVNANEVTSTSSSTSYCRQQCKYASFVEKQSHCHRHHRPVPSSHFVYGAIVFARRRQTLLRFFFSTTRQKHGVSSTALIFIFAFFLDNKQVVETPRDGYERSDFLPPTPLSPHVPHNQPHTKAHALAAKFWYTISLSDDWSFLKKLVLDTDRQRKSDTEDTYYTPIVQ